MAGIQALRKLQMGLEATAGTAVAATTVWRGDFKYTDDRTIQQVPEAIGQLLAKPRLIEVARQATLEMTDAPLTFEQFPYILSASIEGVVTGAADGGGVGKIYEYNLGVTAPNAPKTYTLRVGDNNRVDIIEYAFVTKFTVKGASREPLSMSASWVGRQCTDGDFTGAIGLPAVETALFGKSIVAIDAAAGTIGATPKTSTWLGFEYTVETGVFPLWTGDNSISFNLPAHRPPKITGKLIVLHDAIGEAEILAARAMATRLLRITTVGSDNGGAGAVYTYRTSQFSVAIQYTGVPDLGENEDQVTVELPFEVIDADSIVPTWIVVVPLASLT